MAHVRYGPRTEAAAGTTAAAKDNRTALPDIWSTGVVAVWESDPDAVAQVLPPPLKPAERALVRVSISQVDLFGSPLGAGSFAVSAQHGACDGWYPLVMPMTTERALIGGREVFGEPKKLGEVVVERTADPAGDLVRARLTRHGVSFVEVRGRVGGTLPLPEPSEKLDFYFKFLPAVDGAGLDGTGFDLDPVLVHCLRRERVRRLERVDGEVLLRESPYDPVADLPVLRLLEISVGEKTSDQRGRVVERVSPRALRPYLHQRYDDVQQLLDQPEPSESGREA